ncbi:hypothetical protein LCGC14_1894980, partial [marine sediment metagenome]
MTRNRRANAGRRPAWPLQWPWLLSHAVCCAALLCLGCEGAKDPPPPPPPNPATSQADQARKLPDIPDAEKDNPGAADVLITDTTVLKKFAKPLYTQQEDKMPAGTL